MMKSLITATLLASTSSAVQLGQSHRFMPGEKYSEQSQCDALGRTTMYHYELNKDACTCFYTFDIEFNAICTGEAPVFNPHHVAFVFDTLCIS